SPFMTLLQQAPRLTAAEAVDLARRLYGLDAEASPLPSERDQNFLLTLERPSSPARFVLKIANATEDRELLGAQNAAIRHIAATPDVCRGVVATTTGDDIATVASGAGRSHHVRLLTWLPGAPMASVRHRTPSLHLDLGRRIGEVDRALATFDHPAVHRTFY